MNEAWDMNKVATNYNDQSPERFALNRMLHIIENCASEGLFNTSTCYRYEKKSVMEFVKTRLSARGFVVKVKLKT